MNTPAEDRKPPRIATALLGAALPPGAVRESVLGDLHETYLERAEARSSTAAAVWYWGQVLAVAFRYTGRRWRRPRRRRDAIPVLPGHDPWGTPKGSTMSNIMKDVRFAARLFIRTPGFTLASVLVLALGIGAVTIMFSTLNSVVLRPLPFEDPDQLVWVWGRSEALQSNSISALDYWDYRDEADRFESLGAVLVFAPRVIVIGEGEPEQVPSTTVSYNFFSMLGVTPYLGRAFRPDEESAGAPNVVVMSYAFWQRRYGGRPDLVGSPVVVNGEPYEVVGIMPPGFEFQRAIDLWFPMQHDAGFFTQGRGNNNFNLVGRLGPGVSIAQAQSQVDLIARRLEETYPETNNGWSLRLEPLHERFVGGARTSLVILLGLVGLVLVIACANVASLSLARAMTRNTEVALRLSLGATRARVISQLLTESVLVALAGGALGLVAATFGIGALKAFGPDNLPRLETVAIDGTVLTFTFILSLTASLAFGIVPALRGTGIALAETLKVGGTRGTSRGRAGFRNVLVVGQVALSIMLMVASGLLIQSYRRLQNVDAGFVTEKVVHAEVQLPPWKYSSSSQIEQAWSELHDRIRAVSGVVSVGAIDQVPIRGGGTYNTVYPVDRPPATPAERAQYAAQRRFASDDYFATMGIPILAGRPLEPTDRVGSPNVLVISNTMAQDYFPGENPLGKELALWDRRFQVVGVAGDVREFGLGADFPRLFYVSSRQVAPDHMELLIRTAGDPLSIMGPIREAIWAFDGQIPVSGFEPMDARVSASLAQPRFQMFLVGSFAVIALVLASTGLYGVLAFFVRERTRELGIRVALGARPGTVIGLVVRRGMALVAVGIGAGLLGGLAFGRVIESLLFGVAARDTGTFAGVSVTMAVVALVACVAPALRAVRIDPQEVLRAE